MKVFDLLRKECVRLDLTATSKEDAIHQVAQLARGHPLLGDFPSFCRAVYEREANGTTSIGSGIAIPHARTEQVKDMLMVVGRLVNGIKFDVNDPIPVRLIFLVGTPKRMVTEYLRLVGTLARLLKEDKLREQLLAAPDSDTLIRIFSERENQSVP